jgi:hypothetical protein
MLAAEHRGPRKQAITLLAGRHLTAAKPRPSAPHCASLRVTESVVDTLSSSPYWPAATEHTYLPFTP